MAATPDGFHGFVDGVCACNAREEQAAPFERCPVRDRLEQNKWDDRAERLLRESGLLRPRTESRRDA